MSKKSGGLFTLLTGMAAGAAAMFLSKPENRQLAEKKVKSVTAQAKKIHAEYQKNPEAFEKKMINQGKKMATQALKSAKKSIKTTKTAHKKTVKVAATKTAKS